MFNWLWKGRRRNLSHRPSRNVRLSLESLTDRIVPASLQVIHNSAFAIAEQVDVYVNDTLLIDNLTYKTAQTFENLAAGNYKIDITAGDAANNLNPLFTTTATLEGDIRYIAVAVGDPLAAAGAGDAFNLEVFAGARASAAAGTTDILAFHGSSDAPEVSVRARGVGALVEAFQFRDFAGYVTVPSADYTLDVTLTDGTVVRSFVGPLSGLSGQAITVLATGFVDPSGTGTNNNLGLLAVLADGTVVELPVNNSIVGTANRDIIFVSEGDGIINVTINGELTRFLSATNSNLTIEGLGGNDYINAFFTFQTKLTLDGGDGNDTIIGGFGDDLILGGKGSDLIFGNSGDDEIDGGDGSDIIFGGFGNDRIRGGNGNDIIFGGPGRDRIDGGRGFNVIFS